MLRVAALTVVLIARDARTLDAQSPRRTDDESGIWTTYTGLHPVGDRWRLHLEAQLRQTESFRQPSQRLVRAGLLRVLTPAARTGVGYSFVRTRPPEEFVTDPQSFAEHRVYEQLDLRLLTGPFAVDNRYRLEQRWLERLGTGAELGRRLGWTYTNRARYQLRASSAWGGGPPRDGAPYAFASNEVFVNFGRNVRNNVFDQNRLSTGVGYRFGRALSVETGYLNQIVLRSNGTDVERNHLIVVGFTSEAAIRR